MTAQAWITLFLGLLTLASAWAQFWIRERLFKESSGPDDKFLAAFKGKWGVALIAGTGILVAASAGALAVLVVSDEPLNRIEVFKIVGASTLTILNLFLVQAIYTLRRLAEMQESIARARVFAMTASSIRL